MDIPQEFAEIGAKTAARRNPPVYTPSSRRRKMNRWHLVAYRLVHWVFVLEATVLGRMEWAVVDYAWRVIDDHGSPLLASRKWLLTHSLGCPHLLAHYMQTHESHVYLVPRFLSTRF